MSTADRSDAAPRNHAGRRVPINPVVGYLATSWTATETVTLCVPCALACSAPQRFLPGTHNLDWPIYRSNLAHRAFRCDACGVDLGAAAGRGVRPV